MHKWLLEKAKNLKTEMEEIGCDNLTRENLEEAYYISKILKNLVCVEKDAKIVEAMENSEDYEILEMSGFPKQSRMTVENYRDIDKKYGKMYYTETSMPTESKVEMARKHYVEATKQTSDKNIKMQKLDNYLNEMKNDLKEHSMNMSPEEKTMLKQKLVNISNEM